MAETSDQLPETPPALDAAPAPNRDSRLVEPPNWGPKPENNKGGAPKGNRNAVRYGLSVPRLPVAFREIERRLLNLRKQLKAGVAKKRPDGKLTIVDAALIAAAVQCRAFILKAARAIREDENLTPERTVTLAEKQARAASRFAKIVERLLPAGQQDPPADFYDLED